MTLLLACTWLGTCQADSGCSQPSRFQARLEGQSSHGHVQLDAEACASHLARIAQTLTTWAAREHLAEGHISVLAIGPGPWGTPPTGPAHPGGVATGGLVIATVPCPASPP